MSYLHYHFPEGINAFSTRRQGGFSHGAYASFNCTHYCGDDESCVVLNRQKLCQEQGIRADRLFIPKQVHDIRIADINQDFLTLDKEAQESALDGVDALISPLPDCCLAISTADCIPILLYDPNNRVTAAVHAGWRGTVKGIATATLKAMQERYGCSGSKMHAAIGPGISVGAFEVGDEVYSQFQQAGFDMQRIALKQEKWHIDLWEANRMQLMEWGIRPEAIETAGICTYTHSDTFFSARKAGIRSGRILSGIIRRQDQNAP